MFHRFFIVSAILGLSTGSIVRKTDDGIRSRRSVHYHGPPAPLNQDGTVANTAEVQNAAAAQKAAFAAEFKRLEETERQAAAHPDLTSTSHGYSSYSIGSYNQQNAIQYSQDKSYNYRPQNYIPAPLNKDGTVALTPEVQQAKAAHQAALAAQFQRYQEAARLAAAHPDLTSPRGDHSQYNHNQNSIKYSQGSSFAYNPSARIPAPLNHDGTVAHTAEYNAVAAAHQAEYAKVLQNTKHQSMISQIKHQPSFNNNYW